MSTKDKAGRGEEIINCVGGFQTAKQKEKLEKLVSVCIHRPSHSVVSGMRFDWNDLFSPEQEKYKTIKLLHFGDNEKRNWNSFIL